METTPRCKQAIAHATKACTRFGHAHVSSAHLILGLLALGQGVARNVLRNSGLSLESAERHLSTRKSSDEPTTRREGVLFGSSALEALTRAEQEARNFDHTYLGTEHLLLGLLAETHGEAADLFASIHADRDRIQAIVREELG